MKKLAIALFYMSYGMTDELAGSTILYFALLSAKFFFSSGENHAIMET